MNDIEKMKKLAGISTITETKIEKMEDSTVAADKVDVLQLDKDKYTAATDIDRKIDVPKEIFSGIDKRIAELKKAMHDFDETSEVQKFASTKQKAIDCLEFLKKKLEDRNAYAYKEAIVYVNSVASFIQQLFPTSLIKFLHSGKANM